MVFLDILLLSPSLLPKSSNYAIKSLLNGGWETHVFRTFLPGGCNFWESVFTGVKFRMRMGSTGMVLALRVRIWLGDFWTKGGLLGEEGCKEEWKWELIWGNRYLITSKYWSCCCFSFFFFASAWSNNIPSSPLLTSSNLVFFMGRGSYFGLRLRFDLR